MNMDFKTYKFWDVIKELDWENACKGKYERPYITTHDRLKKLTNNDSMFQSYIETTARAYRNVLVEKLREYSLQKYGNRYTFPMVSDDSLWDLTAHIVGCGEHTYNRIMKHPEKISDYLDKYVENFEYTFND